jgi:hypothetical protein
MTISFRWPDQLRSPGFNAVPDESKQPPLLNCLSGRWCDYIPESCLVKVADDPALPSRNLADVVRESIELRSYFPPACPGAEKVFTNEFLLKVPEVVFIATSG